jgi:dTDP-4-amino-4,6-dideoxygalactose transaminase
VKAFGSSNWHLFQIILPDNGPGTRAEFMTRLQKEHNVGTGYHYAPIHLFTMYRERGFTEGMFPVSEKIGRLTVTLPMFNAMTIADVERAVASVKAVLAK